MQKLHLRPMQDGDIELFKKWLNCPHVSRWYTQPGDWIHEVKTRNTEFSFIKHFIALHNDKPVGFCQYYEYVKSGEAWHGNLDTTGVYSIDYLIGEPEYLRKGLGKQMVYGLLNLIKMEKGYKTVIVQPEPDNTGSCNTLLSCGFSLDQSNGIFILKI